MKIYGVYFACKCDNGDFNDLDTWGDYYATKEQAQRQIEIYKKEDADSEKEKLYFIREMYLNIAKMVELGIVSPL